MKAGLALLILLSAAPCRALEPAGLADRAELTFDDSSPAVSLTLPTGVAAAGAVPLETVEGGLRRRVWRLPGTAPLLELIRPLREQFAAAGYEITVDCDAVACGGFDFRYSLPVLPAPDMSVDLFQFRVLIGQRAGPGPREIVYALASRGRAGGYLQLYEMRVQDAPDLPSQTEITTSWEPEASPEMSGLLERGHVVLHGLEFETGADTLADRGYPSLEAVATFLKAAPGRVVALVGHTDAVGSLEGNTSLSRRRAEAVRRRLIERYGVPAQQMIAQGAGFLAPVASNLTETGRAANRRVEAVLLEE
ncbi:OmpA family protein [Pseudooceanicola sp. C21-150M6]|uniref:OmpA family protein n=1 Tax=Pseudooceanicola sp. C21-150M6 TaxID=3434355 RepID=UPI003D7FB02A